MDQNKLKTISAFDCCVVMFFEWKYDKFNRRSHHIGIIPINLCSPADRTINSLLIRHLIFLNPWSNFTIVNCYLNSYIMNWKVSIGFFSQLHTYLKKQKVAFLQLTDFPSISIREESRWDETRYDNDICLFLKIYILFLVIKTIRNWSKVLNPR